jgi:hypothetical protein
VRFPTFKGGWVGKRPFPYCPLIQYGNLGKEHILMKNKIQEKPDKDSEKMEGYYHGLKRPQKNQYEDMKYLFLSSEDYGGWKTEK